MKKNFRKIFLAAALVLLVAFQAAAQDKLDLAVAQRIRREGLEASSKVMDYLSWLCDVLGPRLSESPQYRKAGEWAVKTLTDLGLVKAAMEPWGTFGRSWELKKFYAAMTAPQYLPLIAFPKAWTPGTNGVIKGDAVLLNVKKAEDLEKYKGKLKGAIVLMQGEQDVAFKFAAEAKRETDDDLKAIALAPEIGARSPFAARMEEFMAKNRFSEAGDYCRLF